MLVAGSHDAVEGAQLIPRSVSYIALVMIGLCGPLAGQPKQASESEVGAAPAKGPSLWTVEERIEKRVNPAARDARRARDLRQGRSVAVGFSPIDGRFEPELFLPVEVVTRLVLNTTTPHERMRELYRAAIASHGWNYKQFWGVLDAASAPYLSLMRDSATLSRERRAPADLSRLAAQVCAASVDLLDVAYETFGKEKFDEFLYHNVAPPIRILVADHADTVDALRKKAGGCQ